MENKTPYTSEDISIIITHGKLDKYGQEENFINKDGAIFIPDSIITGQLTLGQNFNPGQKKTIVFLRCVFNDPINIYQHMHIGTFDFKECTFEKSVSFYQLRTTISLTNNCHFKSDLAINGSGDTICNISNLVIDDLLTISGSFPYNFSLTNINHNEGKAIKKGRLKLSQTHFKNFEANNITLLSILCDENPIFEVGTFKALEVKEFNISTAKGNGILSILESKIEKMYLISCKGSIIIRNSNIDECSAYVDNSVFTVIEGCILNQLTLDGTIEKENIFNFLDSNVSDLEFQSVTNEGELTLTGINIPAKGRLSIQTSNLGKADFFNCKFSDAILEFENSKITEIFLVETNFPKKVRLNNLKNHGQAQLAFGQLHTAFQKQGDTIRSIKYQSREIEAHFYGLNFFSKDFFKKLNLSLNLISNNFGRYWALGILFTFGVGLMFFVFLLVSTDEYHFGFPTFNVELIPSYLKFMNPLRFIETDALSKSGSGKSLFKLNEWSYLWDFLGRIFIAYGFYQTIQAFRRFGRK